MRISEIDMTLREFIIVSCAALILSTLLLLVDPLAAGTTISVTLKEGFKNFLVGFFLISFARAMASYYLKKAAH